MIERYLGQIIKEKIGGGKAIIVFGARQVGKTTLLDEIFPKTEVLWLNGDEKEVCATFENLSAVSFAPVIGRAY